MTPPAGARIPESGERPRDWLFFLCVLALQAAVVLPLDRIVGLYEDDGVYAVTARSLARGDGYVLSHLPGEPAQTKYPPGWPWVLSLAWRVFPSLPPDSWLLVLPGILCSAGAVALARRFLRAGLGFSSGAATMLALATALDVDVLGFLSLPLSEPLFALLVGAAFVLWLPLREPEGVLPVRVVLLAVVGAAAALTRLAGLLLPLALLLSLLTRRRRTEALWLAAIAALCLLPWWLWLRAARTANAALAGNPFAAYDLDYATWVVADLGSLARVVWQNFVQLPASLAILLQGGSGGPFEWLVATGGLARMLAHVVAWAALALLVIGFVRTAKRSPGPLHFLLPPYLAIVLAWPFESHRFYLPLASYLLALIVSAVAPRCGLRQVLLAGTLLVIAVVRVVPWVATAHASGHRFLGTRDDLPGIRAMFTTIERHVPRDAVVAVGRPAMVHLHAPDAGGNARKAVELWPFADPLISMPEGGSFATFYARFPGDLKAASREQARAIFSSLRAFGVTHAVIWDSARSDREVLFTDHAIRLALPIVHDERKVGLKVMELSGPQLEQLLREPR